MFDIRYHITSLIAVFLALAMGILLGTIIVDKGLLVKQKEALVERLEKEFNQIKKENSTLGSQLTQSERFEQTVFSSVSKDQLTGKRLLLMATSNIPEDIREDIRNSLSQAGAESATVIITSPDFKIRNSDVRKKLTALVQEGETTKISKKQLKSEVLKKLAQDVSIPSDRAFLKELLNLGLIRLENEPILPAQGVMFYAGSKEKASNLSEVQLPLIDEFIKSGVLVVGVEPEDDGVSQMRLYQGIGIPTIDNIDTIEGRISLIYVFRGGVGNFGSKEKADTLLPSLDFRNL